MVKLFSNGTKKHAYLDKLKALDPFKGDDSGEIKGIITIVLAIIIGAILTGAIGPSSLGNIVNATLSGGALFGAPSTVKSTWDTIPTVYSIALFLVPIAAIVKYME